MAGFTIGELKSVHETRKGRKIQGAKRRGEYRDMIKAGKTKNYYYVWGNLIASYDRRGGTLRISSAGWYTPLTKDRLNKLLYGTGWQIQQYQNNWYLVKGSNYISSKGDIKSKNVVPFRDGVKITRSGRLIK